MQSPRHAFISDHVQARLPCHIGSSTALETDGDAVCDVGEIPVGVDGQRSDQGRAVIGERAVDPDPEAVWARCGRIESAARRRTGADVVEARRVAVTVDGHRVRAIGRRVAKRRTRR